jgi:hypothetical protein
MDEKVGMVIETVRMVTRENQGVIIEPVGLQHGILRIKYHEGTNEECPECVMPPDSFRDMVMRMCRTQAPYVTDVVLVPTGL